ncbi:MAG: hypothetical protein ABJB11_23310 [Ferruginibacter sp.]
MIRADFTNTLIHLTRDKAEQSAADTFHKIVEEKSLNGSTENIRGKSKCICFSETPISAIGQIVSQNHQGFRYGAFGFMFSKKYLFNKGARPVIYQPDTDFSILPESLQYRHVRFEIDKVDWTWEREWRMKIDLLLLEPEHVTLIVPNREIVEQFKTKNSSHNLGLSIALPGVPVHRKLEWHFITLEDLGYN